MGRKKMAARAFHPRAEAGERPQRHPIAVAALVALMIAALALLTGCGEGSGFIVPSEDGTVEADTVVVEPEEHRSAEIGETIQFDATVLDATGTVLQEALVSWSSSEPSVAFVGSTGVATTFGEGVTEITASSGDATGSATLTVAPAITPPPM